MRQRRQDRAADRAAGDHDAGADHRVQRLPAAAVLVEDELGRLGDLGPGVDRPVVVVHVEDRVDRDQVHVRVEVRVERAHVAPVALVALGRARHLVGGEVVDLRVVLGHQRRDDVAAEVVLGGLVGGVGGDGRDQRLGREHVVAHRGEDLVRRVGQPDGVLRLLAEGGDVAPVGRRLDHAELVGLLDRRAQRRDGHALAGGDVLLDHLARVHAVDVVGAEDDDVLRALVGDQVVVLIDRVGGAHEPARAEPHLRRHRRHVAAEQRRQPPGRGDVAVQRMALVLREDHDLAVLGVDQVREREVDQPVVAAERHRGLGAVGGQRREPLALAAGEHHREDSAHARISRASAMICSRCSSPFIDSA